MRLVFAGTPEVALPSLDALLASRHEVVAVVTRPDARAGRGRTLVPSPVRQRAEAAGLEVLTPERPSDPAFQDRLRELAPDACPVVAYGALVPPSALEIPRHGWVNLHFSLLPAWRGAAPVQHAVMAGDEVTGATTFRLEKGLDTGPVFGVMTERIRPRDTAGDLLGRLAQAGAGLLVATLDGIEDGSLQPQPQPSDGVSLAPKIEVEDARVRWSRPALAVDRQVRGCTPAPGAWTVFRGERVKLGLVTPLATEAPGGASADTAGALATVPDLAPGQLHVTKRAVAVGTASGAVVLGEVRPHGKKAMPAADWARGVRIEADERFEDE
ncbi:methionyl-tRNA formyltransferase [Phycicoccus sp. SLBN-51]|jgi:methionyl-tRNA formyltransferase|uniref:methionyl-tRNA formyltransferase n=1 Tax=Phycicoccus sp. SLBN-51 TaxID=2768447 RepID=UPI001153622A|nr:methionyl-tRNA formyltransferase [Phycicoccus sp. SLBN-51]TQJ51044.1 methionyl-tRNA formyltransferase [Phycicoccus sp. SLBN-51]